MILIVDMNGKKESLGFYEFVLPLLQIAEKLDRCIVKHYTDLQSHDLNSCSHIILSGTALKDNAIQSQPEKFCWLKKVNKPVLGVCAGMQAIGITFDMRLNRCLEIGMTALTTLKENSLFSGSFQVYSLHNFCVVPSAGFEVLAESAKCIQAMKHRQKDLYGVLFHPEVRNAEIVKRFIGLKPKDV